MSLLEQAMGFVGIHGGKSAEKKPVLLTDLTVGSSWKSEKGPSIRINTLEPLTYTIYATDEHAAREIFADLEDLRQKLEARGYALREVSSEDLAPQSNPTVDTNAQLESSGTGGEKTSSATVIDIDTARVKHERSPDLARSDLAETLRLENVGIETEMEQVYEGILGALKEVGTIVEGGLLGKAAKAKWQEKIIALLDEAEATQKENSEIPATETKELTELSVTQRRERLERFKTIHQKALALLDRIRIKREKKEEPPITGSVVDQVGSVASGHEGNLQVLLKVREIARLAEKPAEPYFSDVQAAKKQVVPKKPKAAILQPKTGDAPKEEPKSEGEVGAGDGGGPEGPEEFGTVLGKLREEVGKIVAGLKTPEEFGLFRRDMVTVPFKEGGGRVRRYYFNVESIKDRVRRKITDDEMKLLQALENEIEDLARGKFFEIKNADLETQYQRERAKIRAAKDEVAYTALAKVWSQSPFSNSWESVLNDLTPAEKKMVTEGYQGRYENLKRLLEQGQQQRQDRMVLDTFLERPEGGRIIETLRTILPGELDKLRGALKYRKIRLTQEAEQAEWNEYYFPVIRKSMVEYLKKQPDITEGWSEAIFRVLVDEFEQEEIRKGKKRL